MGWIIALGVLTLIAIVPIGVSVLYDASGLCAYAVAGLIRIPLYPTPKKEPNEEKTQKKQSGKKKTGTPKPQKKKGGSFHDFLPLVDKVLDFLGDFRRKLRITRLEMKLILAGDDPADLAQNYGRAWTALGNLMPLLENVFTIKKRDLEVECDFLSDKTTVVARFDISITIGRVLLLFAVRGIPVLRELMKIMNKRKGGAKA